eukprot:PhF_6_TR20847/c1_g1_i1/m.30035
MILLLFLSCFLCSAQKKFQKEGTMSQGATTVVTFTESGTVYSVFANADKVYTYSFNDKSRTWTQVGTAVSTSGTIAFMTTDYFNTAHYILISYTTSISPEQYKWGSSTWTIDNQKTVSISGTAIINNLRHGTMGSNDYLLLSVYQESSSTSCNSEAKEYKSGGNGYQSTINVATLGARDMYLLTYGSNEYVLVANADATPTNSEVFLFGAGAGGTLTSKQTVTTNGAYRWTSFTISSTTYAALACASYGTTYTVNSQIYTFTDTTYLTLFQSLSIVGGARDVKYLTDGTNHFLVFAVPLTATGTSTLTYSKVFVWTGTTFRWHQDIPTIGASSVSVFAVSSVWYMVFAETTISKFYRLHAYTRTRSTPTVSRRTRERTRVTKSHSLSISESAPKSKSV